MYDMYPWDKRSDASQAGPRTRLRPATRAVQVALDRRDNGGDPAAAPGTPPAGSTRQ
jgi:hypothetical protein